ncbi:unnamed protein product [marine sediment metagenome]|uniref:Uncharacterized protein n=1 Tax=marine sediment metagenome TaxID=412755 RepID=X0X3S0_9ZZZZ
MFFQPRLYDVLMLFAKPQDITVFSKDCFQQKSNQSSTGKEGNTSRIKNGTAD